MELGRLIEKQSARWSRAAASVNRPNKVLGLDLSGAGRNSARRMGETGSDSGATAPLTTMRDF
jgi:hypothetical protein